MLKNNAHERNERKIFRALFHGLLCPWFGLAQSFVVRAQFEKVSILAFHHICDVIQRLLNRWMSQLELGCTTG